MGWLRPLLIGGGLLVAGAVMMSGGGPTSRSPGNDDDMAPPKKAGGGWSDADAPRRIRELARRVMSVTGGWTGLDTFLVWVAFTESRGNPDVGTDAHSNAARGWFGLRPQTAANSNTLPSAHDVNYFTKDEMQAVARAAWLIYRLRNYAADGQVIDWLAIRRGFAFPFLVADDAEVAPVKNYEPGERSRDVRERSYAGVKAAGESERFMYEPAFPPGFTFPGFDAVLAAVQNAGVA